MKHYLTDDVNINLRVDIPTQELETLVDKVADAVIMVIAAATVAHIAKSFFN